MKVSLVLFCFLCTAAAFGQSTGGAAVLNSQPVVVEVPSHPEHATQTPMATEQSLLGNSGNVFARGERPLWEFAPQTSSTSLGDVARTVRAEHAAAKKADVVWVN
jgi:hypothetical protein